MRATFIKFLVIIVLYASFFGCARRGTPTGGPKDSIPPVLVESSPALNTINFKSDKIKLVFDEYIKINELNKNLIISPPQKNAPIIFPAGTASKFISIKILDTLDANTTYAFNFGNSIVDNNEANKFQNFKYVFSTGSYIDSLSLAGEITNPMVKKHVSNIDVMLYEYNDKYTDSIIFKQKPRYISNTLDSTLYEITNLKKGKYLLIALEDANGNKIYNPQVDKIGFISDTISLPTTEKFNFTIFKEIPPLMVIKPKEMHKGHAIFGFEGNAKDLSIELLTETPEDFKSKIIFEEKKDTVHYWYTPFKTDSLIFKVKKGDFEKEFTLNLRSSKIDSLKISPSANGQFHLIDTFFVATNTPIINFDKALINITKKDSTTVDFKSYLSKNSNKLYLDFNKEEDNEYQVNILPKAITDIYNISNDSISYNLKTKKTEDYGVLILNFSSAKKSAFIVELLNSKEEVVRTSKIKEAQTVKFDLVPPAKYMIRVTYDENNNGKWDTGNFLQKIQPEKVKLFDKEIEILANWELDESFTLD